MNRRGIGCLAALLLAAAAVLMVFSVGFTIEVEGPPELSPGFHDNRAFFAAVTLGFGLLLLLAGLVMGLLGPGRVAARTVVAVVSVPLLAFGVFRVTALAPMLSCDGTSIESVAEGVYHCENVER